MELKDRIRRLRRSLDLTQQEFADRIGVKRNTITSYEIGRSQPMDAVISLICREFDVNEDWLRYGKGDMITPKEDREDDVFDEIILKYGLDKRSRGLLESFCKLRAEDRQAVIKFVKLASEYLNDMDATTAAEAAYAEALGYARDTGSSIRNSTKGTQSSTEEDLLNKEA